MLEIARARQARCRLHEAARWWDARPAQPGLPWAVLEALPGWCCWPEPRRARLQHLAGALFCGPSLKRWIDARRVDSVRRLLGEGDFDAVLQALPGMPAAPELPREEEPVQAVRRSGACVMAAGSASPVLREALLLWLLPHGGGFTVAPAVAGALMQQALHLMQPQKETP